MASEDERPDGELKRLQKKYGLSDEALAVWKEAEEKRRRRNPPGWRNLDL